ncbi:FliM/FliN family flagellar motor C-terminal domain-containing protein [Herbaspirillum sp. WGmk3]|uniref:FliM/FliN family flagellar motor switch protein n=1 Tax=Herbaspirillum sp. WGmk3 TaxID=2919925 RepID=UPI0020907767|nr:FliM/FliN family flagellar motor C-terminal domain-containing protein [Herbaspirillum sp. WGmk3]MCO4855925.1 FliM/FliN family flagellar motor C-terminal domain-containing protein [Herbaspirillum sp. WGmk3]
MVNAVQSRNEVVEDGVVKALRWPGASRLERLGKLAQIALEKWCLEWRDDSVSADVKARCMMAHEEENAVEEPRHQRLLYSGDSDDDCIWLERISSVREMAELLGLVGRSGSASGQLLLDTAGEALDDCLNTILEALVGHKVAQDRSCLTQSLYPGGIPVSQKRPWSGAVRLDLNIEHVVIRLHIGPQRAESLAALKAEKNYERVTLVPLQDALEGRLTKLRVELTEVELTLGQLQALREGDVLILPHLLTQALHVSTSQGHPVCGAYLGQAHGNKAIEFTRETAHTAL